MGGAANLAEGDRRACGVHRWSSATGEYKHGFAATEKGLKLKISRADVAGFVLKQLEDDTYLGQTPGLSY